MATTIKVTDTANWCGPFLRYMPITAGVNSEPAVSSANMLLELFLSPPFAWEWNRNTDSFSTTAGTQDYPTSITDFGYLEKASVTDASGNVFELELKDLISEVGTMTEPGRPTFVCILKDDNSGNITLRFSPTPDATYTIKLTYQKAITLITSGTYAAATWAPIPDKYAFIYQNGFLALLMAATTNDPRFQLFWSRFISGIIGVSEGLSEMDKILFLGNMIDFSRQLTAASIGAQQGRQAKAAS